MKVVALRSDADGPFRCSMCGETKPSEEFYPRPARKAGRKYSYSCIRCTRQHESERKRDSAEHRGALKRRALLRYHGITVERFDEMAIKQGGVCAICSRPPSSGFARLHVDHDHRSGEIRGLLCHTCNAGLGQFKDSAALLAAALGYLARLAP